MGFGQKQHASADETLKTRTRAEFAANVNPASLPLTPNPSPTHPETGLRHLLLLHRQHLTALPIHPQKGEPFSLGFTPQHCSHHLEVLKRRAACPKTGRARGEKRNGEEQQKVQLAAALLVTRLSTRCGAVGTGT